MIFPLAAAHRAFELRCPIDVRAFWRVDGPWVADGVHTPLTELMQAEPASVTWDRGGDLAALHGDQDDAQYPLQLERGLAPRSDGEAARHHHPRWHRPAPAVQPAAPSPHSPRTPR